VLTAGVVLYVVALFAVLVSRAKSRPPFSPSSSSLPEKVYGTAEGARELAYGKRKRSAQAPVYGPAEGMSKLKRVVLEGEMCDVLELPKV
jgi:hypothetical protein